MFGLGRGYARLSYVKLASPSRCAFAKTESRFGSVMTVF